MKISTIAATLVALTSSVVSSDAYSLFPKTNKRLGSPFKESFVVDAVTALDN